MKNESLKQESNEFDLELFLSAMDKLISNLTRINKLLNARDNINKEEVEKLYENNKNLTLYFTWQQANFIQYVAKQKTFQEGEEKDSAGYDFSQIIEMSQRIEEITGENKKIIERRLEISEKLLEFIKNDISIGRGTYSKYNKQPMAKNQENKDDAKAVFLNKKS